MGAEQMGDDWARGGSVRNWLLILRSQALSSARGLFRFRDGGRTKAGSSFLFMYFNGSSPTRSHRRRKRRVLGPVLRWIYVPSTNPKIGAYIISTQLLLIPSLASL